MADDPTDEQASQRSLRSALDPAALRAAMVPSRPVFANPWDSEADMFACYAAVCLVMPLLLWAGGALMGTIFSFSSHWHLGVYIAAELVGAAGFITIVGRRRTRLAVDVLAITVWFLLGLVVAPVIGLAPPIAVSLILFAIVLVATFLYVLRFGKWERAFIRTLSWPVTWTLLAAFFAFCAYRLILYQ